MPETKSEGHKQGLCVRVELVGSSLVESDNGLDLGSCLEVLTKIPSVILVTVKAEPPPRKST